MNSQDDFMSRFIAAAIAGAVGVAALIAQAIWKRKKLRQSQELLKRGAQYPPLAPPARQKGELILVLDAFGDHRKVEAARKPDDGAHDSGRLRARLDIRDEGLVDLDLVERE